MPFLFDLLSVQAEKALRIQATDGSMPPGVSGPHQSIDTPVRNTAHWTLSFLHTFRHTGETRFKLAAERCADYLSGWAARPFQGSFWCRNTNQKDQTNGLIGQAWVIEALCAAAHAFPDRPYAQVASEVFHLHPFDEGSGLWYATDLRGQPTAIHQTFNQQLWFAACAAMLPREGRSPEVMERVTRFTERLPMSCHVFENGLINHAVGTTRHEDPLFADRMVGYHPFCMLGFALLAACDLASTADFWKSRSFQMALSILQDPTFHSELDRNPFAYRYNPVGFEIPYVAQVFRNRLPMGLAAMRTFVARQLSYHPGLPGLTCGEEFLDRPTLDARLYEATRLENVAIS